MENISITDEKLEQILGLVRSSNLKPFQQCNSTQLIAIIVKFADKIVDLRKKYAALNQQYSELLESKTRYNRSRKYNDDIYDLVVERYSKRGTYKDIAKEFNMSTRTVWKILKEREVI